MQSAGGRYATATAMTGCEPDCSEGWIGKPECDPYDCTIYPDRAGCDGGDDGGGGGGGSPPEEENLGVADASVCQPSWDPGCRLKRPWQKELDAIRANLQAVRAQGGNCVAVADRGERVLQENRLFFFDGPRTNEQGELSVGDHHRRGEIHVSRLGFGGTINTEAQKAQIFRHEVKHLLGWSHTQMQMPGYQCDG
jgi:hypothetical protein